jgi:hypothetical protein
MHNDDGRYKFPAPVMDTTQNRAVMQHEYHQVIMHLQVKPSPITRHILKGIPMTFPNQKIVI